MFLESEASADVVAEDEVGDVVDLSVVGARGFLALVVGAPGYRP